jgi:beta-lactamase class D
MLDREGYGNAMIGDEVDLFWLDGSLRISPDEQVAFLRRLHAGETGFSDRAMDTVKRIMIADTTGGAVVRGKTGWARSERENLGWWVGWIEQGERVHFFATQVESDDLEFDLLAVRKAATDRILRHLGVR